jgi:hypothetical protein
MTAPAPSLIDQWLLGKINRSIGEAPFRVVLGRDEQTRFLNVPAAIKIVVSDRKTLANYC